MVDKKLYSLPELPYAGNALEPFISEAQLKIHHDKHHAAYVNGANAILERLEKARQAGIDVDMKATLKELSFQAGGHVLHSLFWRNLAPAAKAAKEPSGLLADVLKKSSGPSSASRRNSLRLKAPIVGKEIELCRRLQSIGHFWLAWI